MLRKLCEYKGVEIIEAEACKDHIHMLVSIPPKYSVAQIMGYLKGKSSLMIYEKYANLKYKYGNRHFWCRGYYVSTVGRNRRAVEQYLRNYDSFVSPISVNTRKVLCRKASGVFVFRGISPIWAGFG